MKKRRNLIILSILLLFFLTITILVTTNNIKTFDESIYNMIYSLRNNFFDLFFKTITKLGNTLTAIIVILVLLFILKDDDKKLLLIVNIVSVSINQIIKFIIRRPRPNHLRLIKQGGFSYPSGHAMLSIALYGFLIYVVYKNIKNKYLKFILISILSLIIIGIGISRIYVGVHYPSDILGGYTLSTSILIIIIDSYKNHRGNKSVKDDSE